MRKGSLGPLEKGTRALSWSSLAAPTVVLPVSPRIVALALRRPVPATFTAAVTTAIATARVISAARAFRAGLMLVGRLEPPSPA